MVCNYLVQSILYFVIITVYVLAQVKYNNFTLKDKNKNLFEIIGNTYIGQSIIGFLAVGLFFLIDKNPIFSYLIMNLFHINICK